SAAASSLLVLLLWVAVGRASGLPKAYVRWGFVVATALVALSAVAVATDQDWLHASVDIATSLCLLGVLVLLLRALLGEREVTISTVAGVLAAYLMIGVVFTSAYSAAFTISADAFSATFDPLERFDLFYFSFITLATVGFGDVTPANDVTRALAMSEAVMGQLFLVTVVARVVSLYRGRQRDAPEEESG
ncbi:MAG: potassium channel family protein, partial [Thermoleophilia bacterium]